MNKWIIRENYIWASIFGLLAVAGVFGVCAGKIIHMFTATSSGLLSWALWYEANQIKQQ